MERRVVHRLIHKRRRIHVAGIDLACFFSKFLLLHGRKARELLCARYLLLVGIGFRHTWHRSGRRGMEGTAPRPGGNDAGGSPPSSLRPQPTRRCAQVPWCSG